MIEKLENYLGKTSDILNTISKVLLGLIVASMFTIIIIQVVLRYVFSGGFSWAEEITVFFMAWMTFLGSAIAIKQAEHISVDILVQKMPERLRIIMQLISKAFILLFVSIFMYYGYLYAINSANYNSNVLNIPLVYPRVSIAIASFIMIIHLIHQLLVDFLRLSEVKKQ